VPHDSTAPQFNDFDNRADLRDGPYKDGQPNQAGGSNADDVTDSYCRIASGGGSNSNTMNGRTDDRNNNLEFSRN
jgi:hypothetical protein